MKARFFYAPFIYNTWPKLFVLTSDGMFYCEYLSFKRSEKVKLKFDFITFNAEDYKWGGYQPISEIDEETAKCKKLICQANWIESYLKRKIN